MARATAITAPMMTPSFPYRVLFSVMITPDNPLHQANACAGWRFLHCTQYAGNDGALWQGTP